MPLPIYTLIHSDAKLSPEHVKTIEDWVNSKNDQEDRVRYKAEDEKD
jgi:hypothetical protein